LYYKNVFRKNKLTKIKNKAFIKLKTYNVNNFELIAFKKKSFFNILNNNLNNFSELKNQIFLTRVAIQNRN